MASDTPHNDENAEIRSDDDHDFEPPTASENKPEASNSDFDPPSVGPAETGGETVSSSSVVRQAKEEIERRLAEAASQSSMSVAEMRRVDDPGVIGVGQSLGSFPGRESLVVFVESDAGQEAVRREMTDTLSVRAATDDELPIEIVVTGPIEPLSTNRSKFRPAPAGVSVGHHAITAGTIGGWSRGSGGDRARRLLMVSNNHVLANSNRGRFGDAILQPGTADHGRNPADRIAILERFISITFGGSPNYVDAATGWCWPNLVRRDHVYHAGGAAKYFRIGRSVVEPRLNMVVGKTGRTTDLTRGIVTATGVSINVNFGPAGVAHFRDQFAVRSLTSGAFSAGGDSGSFVWEWNSRLSPVGLLFAGGGGTTFCNRMSRVVAALQVSLL